MESDEKEQPSVSALGTESNSIHFNRCVHSLTDSECSSVHFTASFLLPVRLSFTLNNNNNEKNDNAIPFNFTGFDCAIRPHSLLSHSLSACTLLANIVEVTSFFFTCKYTSSPQNPKPKSKSTENWAQLTNSPHWKSGNKYTEKSRARRNGKVDKMKQIQRTSILSNWTANKQTKNNSTHGAILYIYL